MRLWGGGGCDEMMLGSQGSRCRCGGVLWGEMGSGGGCRDKAPSEGQPHERENVVGDGGNCRGWSWGLAWGQTSGAGVLWRQHSAQRAHWAKLGRALVRGMYWG